MDVTKQDSIDQAVNTAVDQLGGIDILINNAAIFTAAPLLKFKEKIISKSSMLMFQGRFYSSSCCQKND